MKTILLITAMLLTFGIAQAQINVGVTIGPQFPTGSFGDGFKTGFGINAVGRYMLKENMAIGLNLGFTKFGTDIKDISSSMMPITGLFEYHFGTGNIKPYIGADLGLYNYRYKIELLGHSSSDSKIYFGFAPTAGALYGINDKLSLCANLKYNYVAFEGDSGTWLGINIGAIYYIK